MYLPHPYPYPYPYPHPHSHPTHHSALMCGSPWVFSLATFAAITLFAEGCT